MEISKDPSRLIEKLDPDSIPCDRCGSRFYYTNLYGLIVDIDLGYGNVGQEEFLLCSQCMEEDQKEKKRIRKLSNNLCFKFFRK